MCYTWLLRNSRGVCAESECHSCRSSLWHTCATCQVCQWSNSQHPPSCNHRSPSKGPTVLQTWTSNLEHATALLCHQPIEPPKHAESSSQGMIIMNMIMISKLRLVKCGHNVHVTTARKIATQGHNARRCPLSMLTLNNIQAHAALWYVITCHDTVGWMPSPDTGSQAENPIAKPINNSSSNSATAPRCQPAHNNMPERCSMQHTTLQHRCCTCAR